MRPCPDAATAVELSADLVRGPGGRHQPAGTRWSGTLTGTLTREQYLRGERLGADRRGAA